MYNQVCIFHINIGVSNAICQMSSNVGYEIYCTVTLIKIDRKRSEPLSHQRLYSQERVNFACEISRSTCHGQRSNVKNLHISEFIIPIQIKSDKTCEWPWPTFSIFGHRAKVKYQNWSAYANLWDKTMLHARYQVAAIYFPETKNLLWRSLSQGQRSNLQNT